MLCHIIPLYLCNIFPLCLLCTLIFKLHSRVLYIYNMEKVKMKHVDISFGCTCTFIKNNILILLVDDLR